MDHEKPTSESLEIICEQKLLPRLATIGNRPQEIIIEMLEQNPALTTSMLPEKQTVLLRTLQENRAEEIKHSWIVNKLFIKSISQDNPELEKKYKAHKKAAEAALPSNATNDDRWKADHSMDRAFIESLVKEPLKLSPAMLEYLSACGADGDSTLKMCITDHPRIAAAMVHAGVSPSKLDEAGHNIFHIIARSGQPPQDPLLTLLKKPEYLPLLNEFDREGKSPFVFATKPKAKAYLLEQAEALRARKESETPPALQVEYALGGGNDLSNLASNIFDLTRPRGIGGPIEDTKKEEIILAVHGQTPEVAQHFKKSMAELLKAMESGVDFRPHRVELREMLRDLKERQKIFPPHSDVRVKEVEKIYKTIDLKSYTQRFEAACTKQNIVFIKQALDAKDKKTLNAPDAEGNTPLHYAMHHQQWEDAAKLIERGATLTKLNPDGQNVYHLAVICADPAFEKSNLRALLLKHKEKDTLLHSKQEHEFEHYQCHPVIHMKTAVAMRFLMDGCEKASLFTNEEAQGAAAGDPLLVSIQSASIADKVQMADLALTRSKDPITLLGETRFYELVRASCYAQGQPTETIHLSKDVLKRAAELTLSQYRERIKAKADETDERRVCCESMFSELSQGTLAQESTPGAFEGSILPTLKALKADGYDMKNLINTSTFSSVIAQGKWERLKEIQGLQPEMDISETLVKLNYLYKKEPKETAGAVDKNIREFMRQLKKEKRGPVLTDESSKLPAHDAIQWRDATALKRLLEEGMFRPADDNWGERGNPLAYATKIYTDDGKALPNDFEKEVLKILTDYEMAQQSAKKQNALPQNHDFAALLSPKPFFINTPAAERER